MGGVNLSIELSGVMNVGGVNLSLILRDAYVGGVSLTFRVQNDRGGWSQFKPYTKRCICGRSQFNL